MVVSEQGSPQQHSIQALSLLEAGAFSGQGPVLGAPLGGDQCFSLIAQVSLTVTAALTLPIWNTKHTLYIAEQQAHFPDPSAPFICSLAVAG